MLMHVGCNVASLASSVDPERGFLRRLHQGALVAELFPTIAELKLQVGMEKAPHAEEKTYKLENSN